MTGDKLVILLAIIVFGAMIAHEFTESGARARDNAAIANCRASNACVKAIRGDP